MDYRKLYTPTEAATLYNVAKIKYDPTSYSLRGNLILGDDIPQIKSNHIADYNYGSEEELQLAIYKSEPKRLPLTYLTGLSRNIAHHNPVFSNASLVCVQQDNLHICLELLNFLTPVEDLKTNNVLQTMATMCIALNSTKSCAKDMLHLSLNQTCSLPYRNVHVFEYFKDSLKDSKSGLAMISTATSVDSSHSLADLIDSSYTPSFNEHVTIDTLYSIMINSFEVIWAWSTLPVEYQACFVALCNKAESITSHSFKFFEKYIKLNSGGFDISEELRKAISISDPEERYGEYQKIIEDTVDIYTHCKNYYDTELPKPLFINPMFAVYTSFINQISVANIRINHIRILYDYCIAHKYMEPETASAGEDTSSLMSKALAATSSTPTPVSSSTEPASKKLMRFRTPPTSGKAVPRADDAVHDDNAMFEALDKIRASFKSERYSFDVHDVVDTDDSHRAAYEAVANKVSLINKLLIRRIRDIKTYNVGGKNPGVSTGRLDRKAMYRYKYDPNIFYNNTYKTLESDLAFGIILDESGSMSGRGIKDGRTTMVVLHETLKALGINHSIIGHTSDGKHHSEITRYQAFKEDKTYKICKNYALITTEAKSGNCDSGALYYMEKALSRVRNKDKICLIFSDGAPTECTGTELKEQVAHMERNGIKVIGIGINFASISKYYKEYANGRNLADMLNIVAKILEEYVLKKKDK
jgi:hypothetical protein